MKRAQSVHSGANNDFARVESVVAYPQSNAAIQYIANVSAPDTLFTFAPVGRVGGFSPGRTLGPVVATVGVLGAGALLVELVLG